MENKMTLTFTVQEMNIILAALSKQPYEAVWNVVETIKAQVQPAAEQPAQAAE